MAKETSKINTNLQPQSKSLGRKPFQGQHWLAKERDACGVGFIADRDGCASHKLIEQALVALSCMEHRGACSADRDSGDGAGLMTALPAKLYQTWARANNIS